MLQDENMRRWIMYAIIAFGITGVFFEIIFFLIRGGMIWRFMDFVLVIILAAIVGGGVFWASKKLQL
jgi:branched-subunit amino acid transport protein